MTGYFEMFKAGKLAVGVDCYHDGKEFLECLQGILDVDVDFYVLERRLDRNTRVYFRYEKKIKALKYSLAGYIYRQPNNGFGIEKVITFNEFITSQKPICVDGLLDILQG